jgi:hypothetical protein
MGGSAVTASHYLINSTKQINPKVLKKLKGRKGDVGKSGAQGPVGAQGPAAHRAQPAQEGRKAVLALQVYRVHLAARWPRRCQTQACLHHSRRSLSRP